MKVIKTLYFFLQILFLSACSDLFEFSPYDTDIKTHDLNTGESIRISNKISSPTDTLKFAFFSDIHEHYDDFSDAISSINKENGLQFAVCCGDITNAGLKQEYKWLSGELSDTGYYNVLVTHIPPFSEEMNGVYNLAYIETVDSGNTILCLHGHLHRFIETTFNGIPTVVSANIQKREYYIIELIGDKSIIKRINF